jgi:hypothetical protein
MCSSTGKVFSDIGNGSALNIICAFAQFAFHLTVSQVGKTVLFVSHATDRIRITASLHYTSFPKKRQVSYCIRNLSLAKQNAFGPLLPPSVFPTSHENSLARRLRSYQHSHISRMIDLRQIVITFISFHSIFLETWTNSHKQDKGQPTSNNSSTKNNTNQPYSAVPSTSTNTSYSTFRIIKHFHFITFWILQGPQDV